MFMDTRMWKVESKYRYRSICCGCLKKFVQLHLFRHVSILIGSYCSDCCVLIERSFEESMMSNGIRQALTREVNKLVRQEDAIEATKAMIELLEAQVAALDKSKK